MKQKNILGVVCTITFYLVCIVSYSQTVTKDGKIVFVEVSSHVEKIEKIKDFGLAGRVFSIKTACYSDIEKSQRCSYREGDYDQYIEFDKSGSVIIGEGEAFLKKTRYRYNLKGQKIAKEEYSGRPTPSSKINYTYNQKGDLIKEGDYQYTYTQTPKGLKVNKYYVMLKNYSKLFETYLYDKNNNLIEWTSCYPQNEQVEFKKTYTYDENGNLISHGYYEGDRTKLHSLTCVYDEQNRLTSYLLDGFSTLNYKYEYNVTNNTVTENRNGRRYIYQYDIYGNVIEEHSYKESGELSSFYKYEYEYDRYNNWTKRTYLDKSQVPIQMIVREIKYYE